MSIEQQIKTLTIHTQLATEVDLKKENCKGVRDASTHFLTSMGQVLLHHLACQQAEKAKLKKELSEAHELFMAEMHNISTYKILLLSYLDPNEDINLINSINEVANCIDAEDAIVRRALKLCSGECRKYLIKKQQEIINLPSTIAARKSTEAI